MLTFIFMTNSGENDGSTCDLHLDAKIYGDVTVEMGWGKNTIFINHFWLRSSTYFIEGGGGIFITIISIG